MGSEEVSAAGHQSLLTLDTGRGALHVWSAEFWSWQGLHVFHRLLSIIEVLLRDGCKRVSIITVTNNAWNGRTEVVVGKKMGR